MHSAAAEIYTLSLHDALPISWKKLPRRPAAPRFKSIDAAFHSERLGRSRRSEEHTSELQSRFDLVCRLLLEKKNTLPEIHSRVPAPSRHSPGCDGIRTPLSRL